MHVGRLVTEQWEERGGSGSALDVVGYVQPAEVDQLVLSRAADHSGVLCAVLQVSSDHRVSVHHGEAKCIAEVTVPDWLIDCLLIDWLIDWLLIDWLIDWWLQGRAQDFATGGARPKSRFYPHQIPISKMSFYLHLNSIPFRSFAILIIIW